MELRVELNAVARAWTFDFVINSLSAIENVVSFRGYFRSILNPFSVICFKELLDLAMGDILIDIC